MGAPSKHQPNVTRFLDLFFEVVGKVVLPDQLPPYDNWHGPPKHKPLSLAPYVECGASISASARCLLWKTAVCSRAGTSVAALLHSITGTANSTQNGTRWVSVLSLTTTGPPKPSIRPMLLFHDPKPVSGGGGGGDATPCCGHIPCINKCSAFVGDAIRAGWPHCQSNSAWGSSAWCPPFFSTGEPHSVQGSRVKKKPGHHL